MSARRTIVVVAMLLFMANSPLWPADSAQDGFVQLIKEAICAADGIKAGSTREFVTHDFVLDGGDQTRLTSRYTFKKCKFIKIDVTFSPSNAASSESELPNDKVTSVSRPYLEYPVVD